MAAARKETGEQKAPETPEVGAANASPEVPPAPDPTPPGNPPGDVAPTTPTPPVPDVSEVPDEGDVEVEMLISITGTRNGEKWPAPGGAITLPADEAAQYVANGYARLAE